MSPRDPFGGAQKTELAKPLSAQHVRSREQAGRQLSYLESWHAEAEANRIFGFDGWSSSCQMLKCVSERDTLIGRNRQNQTKGYAVSYICRVRIRAGGVVRDGVGAGHGIDRDLGLAHESAIKEAASDAEKRALKTFGDQFGLALYDKEQRNVVWEEPAPAEEPMPAPVTKRRVTLQQRTDLFLAALSACRSQDALRDTYEAGQQLRDRLDQQDPEALEGINTIYAELWAALPAHEPLDAEA